MSRIKFLIVISFALMASSCVNIERNIKLNPDGSGEEKLVVNLHKDFFSGENILELYRELSRNGSDQYANAENEKVQDSILLHGLYQSIYSDTNNLSVKRSYAVLLPDSSRNFIIEYSFTDISKLQDEFFKELLDDSSDVEGRLDVRFSNKKDQAEFYYRLYSEDRSEFIPGDTSLAFAESKLNLVFKDSKIKYRVFLNDSEILESNSDSRNGNELLWEYTMAEFVLYPVEIRVLFKAL